MLRKMLNSQLTTEGLLQSRLPSCKNDAMIEALRIVSSSRQGDKRLGQHLTFLSEGNRNQHMGQKMQVIVRQETAYLSWRTRAKKRPAFHQDKLTMIAVSHAIHIFNNAAFTYQSIMIAPKMKGREPQALEQKEKNETDQVWRRDKSERPAQTKSFSKNTMGWVIIVKDFKRSVLLRSQGQPKWR